MKKYYSPTLNGFTDIPGDDGMELSLDAWHALMENLNSGRELFNDNGTPATREHAPTAEQIIQAADQKKNSLMAEAEAVIALLSRAVKLGIATPSEEVELEEWEVYSVLLMRVDTAAPVWPTIPGV